MHPADEFKVFEALIDEGKGVEDVAARFGVSVLTVQRRSKLSALSPKLLAAMTLSSKCRVRRGNDGRKLGAEYAEARTAHLRGDAEDWASGKMMWCLRVNSFQPCFSLRGKSCSSAAL